MTETEWLRYLNPWEMLAFIARSEMPGLERKLLLYAASVCRRSWAQIRSKGGRRVVRVIERFADEKAGVRALTKALRRGRDVAVGHAMVDREPGVVELPNERSLLIPGILDGLPEQALRRRGAALHFDPVAEPGEDRPRPLSSQPHYVGVGEGAARLLPEL